jgi:hypothetical protein
MLLDGSLCTGFENNVKLLEKSSRYTHAISFTELKQLRQDVKHRLISYFLSLERRSQPYIVYPSKPGVHYIYIIINIVVGMEVRQFVVSTT